MLGKKLIDDNATLPPIDSEDSKVRQFLDLWVREQKHRDLAERLRLERQQIGSKHAADPRMQAVLADLSEGRQEEERTAKAVSVEQFFERQKGPPQSVEQVPEKSPVDLADRSKWSPKLRKLIEERFPEQGKEERIKRATQKAHPKLDTRGLSKETLLYFAEDVELEYDV
jgi:hypothetical protein